MSSDSELLEALRRIEEGGEATQPSPPEDAVQAPEAPEDADALADDSEPAPEPSEGLTTWEYRAVLGGSGSKQATERLNALGAEGWELVGVEPPPSGGQTVLYMKRPVRH